MSMTPEEFWSILYNMPEPPPIFYRLYYNDDGNPIVYSMEDLPGKYIEVDQQTYALSDYHVKIVDNQIVKQIQKQRVKKLKPSNQGICCDPRDVCVVVNQTTEHVKWSITTNEID